MFSRAGFNWWEAWGEIKIEGFGGRPPFGGRPGALGHMGPPLNPALMFRLVLHYFQ